MFAGTFKALLKLQQAILHSMALGQESQQGIMPAWRKMAVAPNPEKGCQMSMTLLSYKPAPKGQLLLGEHRDATWITILTEVGPGGLQVRRASDYVDADGVGDTFIVNTGRALQEFSQGFFRATCHRVISRAAIPDLRISMPFFYDTNDGVHRTKGGCDEEEAKE